MRYLVLFSPAIVLFVMTVVVALNHGNISSTMLVVFLAALTVSAVAAEIVRIQLRREARDHRERPIR
jgi:hypothetical protein